MPQQLANVLEQADALLPAEQMQLIAYLAQRNLRTLAGRSTPSRWSELCGMVPNLLENEDAQKWVTRTRQESQDLIRHEG